MYSGLVADPEPSSQVLLHHILLNNVLSQDTVYFLLHSQPSLNSNSCLVHLSLSLLLLEELTFTVLHLLALVLIEELVSYLRHIYSSHFYLGTGRHNEGLVDSLEGDSIHLEGTSHQE